MAFFVNKAGNFEHAPLEATVHSAAHDAKMSVKDYINKMYAADVDQTKGTAFSQMCASEGLVMPSENGFGFRSAVMNDVLDGKSLLEPEGIVAGPLGNSSQTGAPFGSAARILFPVAVLDIVQAVLQREDGADSVTFDSMVAQNIGINGDSFIQPVIDYRVPNGPEEVKPQRAAEFGEMPTMLTLKTAEKIRTIPTFTMGIEFSDKARNSLTIDVIALSIARYLQVEKDSRVYGYLSDLFNGNNDLVNGAIPAVTTNSLDSAATGGVMTHKAWVKFLATQRRFRKITHLMMDIDTYLRVEARTGRPGSNNYDPTLVRIDPQLRPMNQSNIGFGNDVKYYIVDSMADGGPIPANTIWAIDQPKAIARVRNTAADYSASQEFALRRTTAMRWDYSEAVFRAFGDTDLRPFAVLTISS